MSSAAAAAAAPAAGAADAAEPKKGKLVGKKKLLVVGAALVLLLLLAGGGAVWWMKAQAAKVDAEAGDDGAAGIAKGDDPIDAKPRAAPTFMPLEPFVVNLADKGTDRFAQIGITLQLENAVAVDELKAYMPAVRNAILMILAHKTSAELLEREGKERLAAEILRESVRPMGIVVPLPRPVTQPASSIAMAAPAASGATSAPKPVAKKREPEVRSPVQRVHFSSFIIQ